MLPTGNFALPCSDVPKLSTVSQPWSNRTFPLQIEKPQEMSWFGNVSVGCICVHVHMCLSLSKYDTNVHTPSYFAPFWEIPGAQQPPSWGSSQGPRRAPPGSGLPWCSWLSPPQPSSAVGVRTSSSTCWTISASFQTPRSASMPLWSFRTCRLWIALSILSSTASSAAPCGAGKDHTRRRPLSWDSNVCLPHSRAPQQVRHEALQGPKGPASLTKANPGPGCGPGSFSWTTFYGNCLNQVIHRSFFCSENCLNTML